MVYFKELSLQMKQEKHLKPSQNIQLPIKNGKLKLKNRNQECGIQFDTEVELVAYPGKNSTCARVS